MIIWGGWQRADLRVTGQCASTGGLRVDLARASSLAPVPPFSFGAGTLLFVQRMSPVLGDLLTNLAWRQAFRHQILLAA